MITLKAEGTLYEYKASLLHLVEQGDQNMVCHPNEITGSLLRFL
jgi:hypothetical protein